MTPQRVVDTAVLIAAYNAEATLERAIVSALEAPETAEVCVIDDASQDGTLRCAQAWSARDARVKVIAQPANAGPAAARNRGIDATTAPWITILDADDYFLPGRLTKLHAHAEEADFVAGALTRIREGEIAPAATAPFRPEPLSFEQFLRGNMGNAHGPLDLGFLKPMFRRAFIDAHGIRYQEHLRLGEDYELYARALALGARFLLGGPVGYISVERPGSLSKDHSEGDLERMRDCDDALGALRPLSHSERRALRAHWTSVDCRLQWRRLISAVKARDARAAMSTFHTPASAAYLGIRLAEQAMLRGGRGFLAGFAFLARGL